MGPRHTAFSSEEEDSLDNIDHQGETRVEPRDHHWVWEVKLTGDHAVTGEAQDRETARRSGAFVSAALASLARIGRRRF